MSELECDRPLDELARLLAEIKPVADPALPPFAGGAVGYIAYDVVRQYERLPDGNPDDLAVPDICYMLTDTIVAFDNVSHAITVIRNVRARPGDNLDELYDQACGVVNQIVADLRAPLPRLRPTRRGRASASGCARAFRAPPLCRPSSAARATSARATSSRRCCRSAWRPASRATPLTSTGRCAS